MNKILGSFLAPFLLGATLFSCSKDDTPREIISVDQIRQMPAISLTFEQEVSEVTLLYTLLAKDGNTEMPIAFVDLNNNRKYDKGESLEQSTTAQERTLKLGVPSKTVRLYGDFTRLEVKNKGLESIDGEGLSTINELKIQNAPMQRNALDRLVTLLGEGKDKSICFDEMRASTKQISTLLEKGWKVTNSFGNPINPLQDLTLISVEGGKGSEVKLPILSILSLDKKPLWIDTNLDGIKDEGEQTLDGDSEEITIPLDQNGQGVIAVRGNLDILIVDESSDQATHSLSLSMIRNGTTNTFKLGSGLGIKYLDVKAADRLKEISVGNNPVSQFFFPTHEHLRTIALKGTQIEEIDCSPLKGIQLISLENGNLKDIKLPRSAARYTLKVGNNQLTRLDLSQTSNIIQLDAHSNKLCDIVLWEGVNRTLQILDVNDNELSHFEIGKFKVLNSLKCGGNLLTSMDLNPKEGEYSALTELDLSNSKQLQSIDASRSESFSRVNLSNCPMFDFSTLKTKLKSHKDNFYRTCIITVDRKVAIPTEQEQALKEMKWNINRL